MHLRLVEIIWNGYKTAGSLKWEVTLAKVFFSDQVVI